MMSGDGHFATFWSHAQDLRTLFLSVLFVITFGVIASFVFYEPLLHLFTYSLNNSHSGLHVEQLEQVRVYNPSDTPILFEVPKNAITPFSGNKEILSEEEFIYTVPKISSLVLLSPMEGVLSAIHVSFWVGVTITSPVWLFLIMRFLTPALYKSEKKIIWLFLGLSLIFISCGILFALFITIPIANHYFYLFNQSLGINLWSLKHYLDYTLFLILANAFAFELGVLGIFAVHFQLVSRQWLIEKRSFAIVFAFILGALLTPPDVLTQVMLALPLIGIYEFMIIYAKLREYSKSKGTGNYV